MKCLAITFVFLVALFAHSYSYTIPPVFAAAYDDGYFVLRVPDDEKLTQVAFHYNHNKPLNDIKSAKEHATISTLFSRTWSITFGYSDQMEIGEYISYIATITRDGVDYTIGPETFTVKEILPAKSRS